MKLPYYYYLKLFFSRTDVQIVVFSTLAGGVLQIACQKYLEKHPDLIMTEDDFKKIKDIIEQNKPVDTEGTEDIEKPKFRKNWPVPNPWPFTYAKLILKAIAEHGVKMATAGGATIVGGIAVVQHGKAVAKIVLPNKKRLWESSAQNLPDFAVERVRYVFMGENKIQLLCEPELNLGNFFEEVGSASLPFEKRAIEVERVLGKLGEINDTTELLAFISCVTSIIHMYHLLGSVSGRHIMYKKLLELLKEGKLTKIIVKAIIRPLMRKKLPIDGELMDYLGMKNKY